MDKGHRYDEYWEGRAGERTRERSVERAAIAAALLAKAGTGRPGRLLDVGCGRGHAATFFAERGYAVTGIDVSARAAAEARAAGIEVLVRDVERDELPAGPFDVILVLEVLEHLLDPLDLLARLWSIAAPAGRVVASLPNEFNLARRLAILIGREPFGGHDDPHIRHFGWRAAARLFRAAGCEPCAVRAAPLVPPRFGVLNRACGTLARACPRLLGISFVACLRRIHGTA